MCYTIIIIIIITNYYYMQPVNAVDRLDYTPLLRCSSVYSSRTTHATRCVNYAVVGCLFFTPVCLLSDRLNRFSSIQLIISSSNRNICPFYFVNSVSANLSLRICVYLCVCVCVCVCTRHTNGCMHTSAH